MRKLLICLIAVSVIACGGCAGKGTNTSAGSDVSASDTSETGFYGAVRDMKICGKDVSLPCTFKELGKEFSYDSPIEDKNSGYMFTTFRYEEKDIGVIYLELRDDKNYDKAKIVSLTLNSNSEATVKGAGIGSSEDDVKNAFGDIVRTDLNLDYGTEEDGLVRMLLSSVDNTVSSITIMLPEKDR